MHKERSRKQKQPFNISISFNINPKNILQTHHRTRVSCTHHLPDPHHSLSPNPKSHHAAHLPDPKLPKNRESKKKKPQSQDQEVSQLGKKQLDLLKKRFLSKINNINIELSPSGIALHPSPQQDGEDNSSVMSAKMQEFGVSQLQPSPFEKNHNLHLDLQDVQYQKSKVLGVGSSKGLGTWTGQKDRGNGKQSLSQTRQLSKGAGRKERELSWWTEQRKKSGKKEKEDNLKDKLQRFKVDMMKLALVYEESELLKTKMSSEYYNNVRSRQISKDNDIQFSEGEEQEQIQEIRHFESHSNPPSQDSDHGPDLHRFKEVYQSLKNSREQEGQMKPSTQELIGHYQQMIGEEILQEDSAGVSKVESPADDSSSPKISRYRQEGSVMERFIEFISLRFQQNQRRTFGDTVNALTQEFLQQEAGTRQQQQEEEEEAKPIASCGVSVVTADLNINKELLQVSLLSKELLEGREVPSDMILQLESWEKTCTQQLLSIKSRMWREYRNIQHQLQSRIASGCSYPSITTHKSKTNDKMMKCLSQKMLKSHCFQAEQWIPQKQPQKSSELSIQRHHPPLQQHILPVSQAEHPAFSAEQTSQEREANDPFPISEHLEVEVSSEQFSSEEQFLNGRVVFQEESQLKREKSRQGQVTGQVRQLTVDDKQDIFEFIFLDLCIQLYQEYVQKERLTSIVGPKTGAEKILDSIRKYISEEKKRKSSKEARKIGISTNINTIRNVLKQLISFLAEPPSNYNIQSTLLHKINSPLGPSEEEMLKSLRIPVIDSPASEEELGDQEFEEDLLILQPEWFLLFENEVVHVQELKFNKYYQSEERDQQRVNFLRNCTHIHHKAIFDCLNENLDYFRSFGLWGKPFVWKKKASFQHHLQTAQIEQTLNKAASEVLRSTTFACGLMANKEESLIRDIAGDEQYVRKLQDQRIYKYLENFVVELEEKWFFHDDEEAEILVQMSHIIWTLLIKELLRDISRIGRGGQSDFL